MLEEIARVLFWLEAGDLLARLGILPVPSPVIGLMLLYGNLLIRGEVPAELGGIADRLLGVLGMLFVPAGVGVVGYLDLLQAEIVPVMAAVIGGTLITIAATAFAAERFGALSERRRVRLAEVHQNA
jgi:holin-like protein